MSYIPSNPYYAWVYLKIGLFEATPIPPEHLISMEISKGPGGTSVDKKGYNAYDATSLMNKCKIVLFDETALRVEAQILLGASVVQFCYGYLNGPRSDLFNLYVDKYTTNFSRAGSTTLTLELLPQAALAFKLFDYVTYEGLTLNEIVETVRRENGWGGGYPDTVPKIIDVKEKAWEKDPENPDKWNEIERPKIFIRMNQNPIDFLQYEIAPYCETEGGYGDFRLWFDSPASPYENSIKGDPLGDIANAVSDFFKGFLTKLTDPLMKEINKALGDVLGWVAVSLSQVQELIGSLGGFISDAMSKLTGALGSLQSVAKQAISALASGGLSGMTQSLTSSLMSAGMNMIKGAVGGMLDKVTSGLTSQLGSLTGGNLGGMLGGLLSGGGLSGLTEGLLNNLVGSLAGGLGDSLTKLNHLTNISMLNMDSLNKFKNAGKFAKAMNNLSMSGSIMHFRPIIMELDDQAEGVTSSYFFEVGSTGGQDGESSVLDFNYTEPGGGMYLDAIGKDILLAAINTEDGGLILSESASAELLEAKNKEGALQLQTGQETYVKGAKGRGRLCLALSSDTPEGLEKLSASMFALYKRQNATRVSMKVFGDPSLRLFKKIQVTVMTKTGQVHYSSGYYMINKLTDNIQGGVFTTSIEAFKHPDFKGDDYEAPSIQGGAVGGVMEWSSIDNSGDAQINETRGEANTNVTDRQEDISLEWEEDIWGNKTLGNEDIDEYLKEGE